MKHVFLMDPIHTIKLQKDTSYYIMLAAKELGHDVYHANLEDITFQQELFAQVSSMDLKVYTKGKSFEDCIKVVAKKKLSLNDADVIWIRKDPPFNNRYLYLTQLLDQLKNVKIINHPQSIRDWNEKLSILNYPEFTPWTMVSEDLSTCIESLKQKGGKFVLKPLDGFGGRGIEFIDTQKNRWQTDLESFLKKQSAPSMIQEFIEESIHGDKRVLFWQGKVLGAILRVHAKDSQINNLDAGGKAVPTDLSMKQLEICNVLGKEFQKRSLDFVGIDFLGDYLTEINITSPTGLQELCRFHKKDYHIDMLRSLS